MTKPSFADLVAAHAANVKASAEAWTAMTEAQALARVARDAERKSAEALGEFIAEAVQGQLGSINPAFDPVDVDVLL